MEQHEWNRMDGGVFYCTRPIKAYQMGLICEQSSVLAFFSESHFQSHFLHHGIIHRSTDRLNACTTTTTTTMTTTTTTTMTQQQQHGAWLANVGRGWRIGRVDAFRPKGHGFYSRSSLRVGTLGKSLTHSCLWRFDVKLRRSIRAVSGAPLSSSGLEEAL